MFKSLTGLFAAAALMLTAGAAQAQIRVQGAGASFPAPIYAEWIKAYNSENNDVKVDYQAIGSGGGIKGISGRTVNFAGSDAPLTAEQEKGAPAQLLHIPTVAGPVVMIYNIPGVSERIKLDGDVISGIFLGEIKQWDDAKIASLNPGVKLPDEKIKVVHRSDGSGTSFIYTSYLSSVSAKWKDTIGFGTAVKWPIGLGGKGNDGVASVVKGTVGSIGYVEWAYAKHSNLSYALLVNKAGKSVEASIESVQAAASNALKSVPEDFKVSIVNADGDESYPIAGFTYLLVYQDLGYLGDENLARETVKFIDWCVTKGQATAGTKGYAALPADMQGKADARIKTITFNGKPLLK